MTEPRIQQGVELGPMKAASGMEFASQPIDDALACLQFFYVISKYQHSPLSAQCQ
jgi:hypothetical protein